MSDTSATPDPDLVTPETDPTPESDDAVEIEEDRDDLDAAQRWAGSPQPTDGSGPLP